MRQAYTEVEELVLAFPFGGLVDGVTPDVPGNTDASYLLNLHLDRAGYSKRRGRALVGTLPETRECFALVQYRTDERKLFGVIGQHLVYYPEPGVPVGAVSGVWPPDASDVIGNGLKPGAFVQFNSQLFYADGGTERRYFTGTATGAWGFQGGTLPVPTFVSQAATGSLTQTKWYGIAYALRDPVRKLTTNPSTRYVSQLTGVNDQFNMTAPAFAGYDPAFTELIVLRTLNQPGSPEATAASLFYEETITLGAGLPQNFTVDLADGEVQTYSSGSDNAPPVAMDFICLLFERIFGFKGSKVYFSKDGGVEGGVHAFPPLNEIPVERDAGDDIGGLFGMGGQVFAVKQGAGVFLLAPALIGDRLDFEVQKVTGAAVGCVSPFSVAAVENYVYWLDDKGVVEFDGTNARIISDDPGGGQGGIRDTFLEMRATGRLATAVAVVDRQPDRRIIRWLMPRTVEVGGVTYWTTDHLSFDLGSRRWIGIDRPGGNPAADRVTGLYDRVVCQGGAGNAGGSYRDSDEASHVYLGDVDGNVYRLRTDLSGAEVFSDNGTPYLAEMRSKLLGNGLDHQLPLNLEAEVVRSLEGGAEGDLTLSLWREGFDGAVKEQTFQLWDGVVGGVQKTRAFSLNADRMPCRRVAVGFRHDGDNGDLTVTKLRLRVKLLGRTQRGA